MLFLIVYITVDSMFLNILSVKIKNKAVHRPNNSMHLDPVAILLITWPRVG